MSLVETDVHGEAAAESPAGGLVGQFLEQQGRLTAVDRFAHQHAGQLPPEARYYRDLIPMQAPAPGEQYAFEVELDACTGCKACVTACHSLNGLDEDETWRSVGLLLGGSSQAPVLQHVTTACHHCLDPACLNCCPVEAYEKDPATGIVKHLDDQCIGCQYCVLACPYDVPKYNADRGIVRKCDMCSDRLAAHEAPACVQACPNRAIRISVVDVETIRADCEANSFLPGAPEPGYTLPTTRYESRRPLPRNLLPADHHRLSPEHHHPSLVAMLVLTQMSVGAFVVQFLLDQGWGGVARSGSGAHALCALGLGLVGMGAAVFHLGRPAYAFRAIIGLRTSWLSREILAFTLFALLAGLAAMAMSRGDGSKGRMLGGAAAAAGLVGVFCSVMIYASTRRPFWSGGATAARFFASTTVLGLAASLALELARIVPGGADIAFADAVRPLARLLLAAGVAKLAFESTVFAHLSRASQPPLKRAALLLIGRLGRVTVQRYFFGILGTVIGPVILLSTLGTARQTIVPGLVGLCFVLASIGELLERRLFFSVAVAPRMPGGLAA